MTHPPLKLQIPDFGVRSIMRNRTLMLTHPIDHLELYETDPGKWDCLNPPDLFLVDNSALVPLQSIYMPPLGPIEIENTNRAEPSEHSEYKFYFRPSLEVNELWATFLRRQTGNFDVQFETGLLIVRCNPRDLQNAFDELSHRVGKARKEYCKERDVLLWQIFEKMVEVERRGRVENEILSECQSYSQKRRERERMAEENGWSVSFCIQNLNHHYREVLENKFSWWSKILDATTIGRYRALFEQAFLVI
jgi:hypothetical protein